MITGGTRGLGKALARQALLAGDAVVVTGRRQEDADAAAEALRDEVARLRDMAADAAAADASANPLPFFFSPSSALLPHSPASLPPPLVRGFACDVSDAAQVAALGAAAPALLGGAIDAWVINAGQSGAFRTLVDAPAGALEAVVRTNLLGALLCAREAARRLAAQPGGGHVFFIDGAGADGAATPCYAAYGATKAALPQLARTLRRELATAATASTTMAPPADGAAAAAAEGIEGAAPSARRSHPVGVHVLSPGMMVTDLLLEGATLANKQVGLFACLLCVF